MPKKAIKEQLMEKLKESAANKFSDKNAYLAALLCWGNLLGGGGWNHRYMCLIVGHISDINIQYGLVVRKHNGAGFAVKGEGLYFVSIFIDSVYGIVVYTGSIICYIQADAVICGSFNYYCGSFAVNAGNLDGL